MSSTTSNFTAATSPSTQRTYSTPRPAYRTFIHFELLLARVASAPGLPFLKLPDPGAPGTKWIDVSYQQFEQDVTKLATYWSKVLGTKGIPPKSVVGVWLRGFTYPDVVTIIALSRASYIPQLFGFELPNTRIVYTLLSTYAGQAIIHHADKTEMLAVPPKGFDRLPCFVAPVYTDVSDEMIDALFGGPEHVRVPEYPRLESEDDWEFLHHSSGSVSGMPKVVPRTNRWLEAAARTSPEDLLKGSSADGKQDVFLWTESYAHTVAMHYFLLILNYAASIVQPTRIDFTSAELANMIKNAGVNRIVQFTNVLKTHLEDARRDIREKGDDELLRLMSAAKQVSYTGMPLPSELEEWAVGEGVKITNHFGCTECGLLFASTVDSRTLKLLPMVEAAFVPAFNDSSSDVPNGTSKNSSATNSTSSTPSLGTPESGSPTAVSIRTENDGPQLYELFVLPTSQNLPISGLQSNLPDSVGGGKGWKSGDLFEKVLLPRRRPNPGEAKTNRARQDEKEVVEEFEERYIFRGRDDDWIKGFLADKLDTRSLEDIFHRRCPDLVANCVVVGSGRPLPALFVEVHERAICPQQNVAAEGREMEDITNTKTTGTKAAPAWWSTPEVQRRIEELKSEIVARVKDDMELRYVHERIEDPNMVIIVPHKSLPRTAVKGNIRRRAVEEQFAQELEALYGSMSVEEMFSAVYASLDEHDLPKLAANAPPNPLSASLVETAPRPIAV